MSLATAQSTQLIYLSGHCPKQAMIWTITKICLLHRKIVWINRIGTLIIKRPHSSEGDNPTLSECSGILNIQNLRKSTVKLLGSLNPQSHNFFHLFSLFHLRFGRCGTQYCKTHVNTNPGYKSNYTCHLSNFIPTVWFLPSQILIDLPNDVLELALISSWGLIVKVPGIFQGSC